MGGELGEDYSLLTPYACVMRVTYNKEIINIYRNDVEGGSILVVRYRHLEWVERGTSGWGGGI